MKSIKEHIQDIVTREYQQGARHFVITGSGELATFIEIAIRDSNIKDINYLKTENNPNGYKPQCSLIVTKNGNERKIDILSELSKLGVYY